MLIERVVNGLTQDEQALPGRFRLGYGLDLVAAILEEDLGHHLRANGEGPAVRVDVQESSGFVLAKGGQAFTNVSQIARDENHVFDRPETGCSLGDDDASVAVGNHNSGFVAFGKYFTNRSHVIGKAGAFVAGRLAVLPAARQQRGVAVYASCREEFSRRTPPPRPVSHTGAMHKDNSHRNSIWSTRSF